MSRAAYIENEGERFALSDYPTTAKVLTSGEIAVVNVDMSDSETKWMGEYGINSLLLAPLFEKEKIIGLIEIACSDRTLLSNQEPIRNCENVTKKASSWLKAPLKENGKEDLFKLARELKRVTNASACSLSSWQPDLDDATVVISDSSAFWNLGAGPKIPLKEWMSAKLVLERNLPTILVASDPDMLPEERVDLDEFKSLTKVIVPLTVGTRPIGFIDASDVEVERSISEKELFSWGGIAGQAALAIQNAQLMDMAQEVLDKQTALRRSIEVISSSIDRDVMLTGLAEQLGNAVDATSVYINEFQNDYKSYKAEACFISSKGVDKESQSILGKSFPLSGNTDFRKYLQRGQTAQLHVNDVDIAAIDLKHLEKHGSKSRLYIPIFIRDKQFGFAEIWESRSLREFTRNEIDLCVSMCLQAAVAIENANLFSQAQVEIKLRRQFEEKLRHEALHDPLTRLPNRRLFIDRLEQAILRRSRQEKFDFSVLCFDLDKFKWINDSFGHREGDNVLIQVADCITDCIRKSDTAARFGGDEFLILIEGDNDSQQIERVCQEIQSRLRSLITINYRAIPLSASIGVAMSTEELMSADDYINRADIAMYEAKSSGGSHIKKFATDDITIPIHHLNLSISQITDPEFTSRLRGTVNSLEFPANRINFEITESLFVHNVSQVSSVLLELQEMGFSIHLDDFGTGFSSLSYLTELPFDVIKIDRSFINKLGSNNEPLELLESIVSIGKNMKKDVIGEGIETEVQLAILKGLNCQYGQGFLFSPALPAPDLETLLLEWQYGKISRK